MLTDSEKLQILRCLTEIPRKSQEVIAEEIHHRKTKIGEVLNEFKCMSWEKAKAFCSNEQHILALRDDYVEMRVIQAKEYDEKLRLLFEDYPDRNPPPISCVIDGRIVV
jgi:NhaP-type Na+/H+ and K+/H+ antiporter